MRPLQLSAFAAALPAALLAPAAGAAQTPRPGPADSAYVLPEVTVARRADTARTVPLAVSVVAGREVLGARPGLGLDESLAGVPGVHVANRYNWSLDQRLSVRGFGARANFGVRGVLVLLDGIPQTLADGQSQLNNVDYALVERIEVLRGAASALYGNAAGGVVSLGTRRPGEAPFAQRLRAVGGAFGTVRWTSVSEGRRGALAGRLAVSRLTTDGPRQHSAADQRRLDALVEWSPEARTVVELRAALADDPVADNPGALTAAEYAANPDSAAPLNLQRDAGKAVGQQQAALVVRRLADDGGEALALRLYGLHRDLDNPLATGVYVAIDRWAGGARLDAGTRLGRASTAPRLALGLDLQLMRDHRRNLDAPAGEPTGAVALDQLETVTQLGPSAQLRWSPSAPLALLAGARWDRVRFDVEDRHLQDGGDDGGARTMSSPSALAGASWTFSPALTMYGNVGTAFETPTTTELANRTDGTGGVNEALGPQRAVSVEAGVRGGLGGRVTYEAGAFRVRVRDAIVQFREEAGRAFFRNAGRTAHDGLEVGVAVRPAPWLSLLGGWTWARHRFAEYRPAVGGVVDTLDGNQLPGVPRHFARVGVRLGPAAGVRLELDQTLSSAVFADDRNTIAVAGWGAGVTTARLSWEGTAGRLALAPFASVANASDRAYVASVSVNGFNGRVLEPAPRRHLYVGLELGWAPR